MNRQFYINNLKCWRGSDTWQFVQNIMSWLNTSSFTNLAISALKEAQKTIDKALDIQNEEVTTPIDSGKYFCYSLPQVN